MEEFGSFKLVEKGGVKREPAQRDPLVIINDKGNMRLNSTAIRMADGAHGSPIKHVEFLHDEETEALLLRFIPEKTRHSSAVSVSGSRSGGAISCASVLKKVEYPYRLGEKKFAAVVSPDSGNIVIQLMDGFEDDV